jgi:hypothetical protein
LPLSTAQRRYDVDLPADVLALAEAARTYDLTAIDELADRLTEAGDAALLRATLRHVLGVATECFLDVSVEEYCTSHRVHHGRWYAVVSAIADERLQSKAGKLPSYAEILQVRHSVLFRDIVKLSAEEVLAFADVGPVTLRHLRSLLGSLGLKLRGD